MKTEKTKLDSKGRALIPKSFRETLGLKEDDPIFVSLDNQNHAIIICQYAENNVYQMVIGMGDTPGTLAKLAQLLYKNNIDLIATESHSTLRTKGATWRILCSAKNVDMKKLRKLLLKNLATSVTITKL
ncbi:MAG: AbrB/MazE/SpoVT family DNA-binding domain-containing protein [Candidatus Micrarchaeota archaeon]